MSKPAASPDRAVFSVTELAELSGISRWRMSRLLTSSAVPMRRSGSRLIVMRHELEDAIPGYADALHLRLRGASKARSG